MRIATLYTLSLGAVLGASAVAWLAGNGRVSADADQPKVESPKRWSSGKGWGWVWGPQDEVGSLNEMTDASRLQVLRSVRQGKVYDLGVLYSRNSYKWPGHSPGEVISFRSPEGVRRQGDVDAFVGPSGNATQNAWHSSAMFINDNVGTQIDGLGHVTAGADNHWYNGFAESKWGGDFGIRKCSADTIPPIIARGVLIDVAGAKSLPALPAHYPITIEDLQAALEKQKVDVRVGDVVLIRTGTGRFWKGEGSDHAALAAHDSAGLTLAAAKWLVEQKGAMLLGADTSGLECNPPAAGAQSPIPVHHYLLIEQGVHIGELHFLEDLARDQAYEFCYVAVTNRVAGAVAGFCMRPIAIR